MGGHACRDRGITRDERDRPRLPARAAWGRIVMPATGRRSATARFPRPRPHAASLLWCEPTSNWIVLQDMQTVFAARGRKKNRSTPASAFRNGVAAGTPPGRDSQSRQRPSAHALETHENDLYRATGTIAGRL
ncbi:hypothetical protein LX36DRAFT_715217 [Colletotrichum falcatum]|nr:hypothetical protein LX36DRAFT_715217 [Colletotrichum falcatum]